MKRSISKLFQENQNKLNEAPTPRSWRKLERRLEGSRQKKWALFRQSIVITAVVLLLAIISVFAVYFKQAASISRIEELKLDEQDPQTLHSVEFARQFRQQLASAVEEGDATKRFMLASSDAQNQAKAALSDFDWLVGEWKCNSNRSQSREIWTRKNKQTLEGTGFLISSTGDTVFSESLRIYSAGNKIYFETTLAQGQQPTQYNLKKLFSDQIIFENSKIDFPQQVILDRHSPNVYSFILQNEIPLGVSEAQHTYLNQRNKVVNQYIIRVMERAKYQ